MNPKQPRILVAGIGNIFFGDDGFGVVAARSLADRDWPANVEVIDFGIRGFDLACALLRGYEMAILLDTLDRGSPPGTLHVLELDVPQLTSKTASAPELSGHSLDPVAVIRLAQQMGGELPRLYLVGCQPAVFDNEDESIGLSPAVQAAIEPAILEASSLAAELTAESAKLDAKHPM